MLRDEEWENSKTPARAQALTFSAVANVRAAKRGKNRWQFVQCEETQEDLAAWGRNFFGKPEGWPVRIGKATTTDAALIAVWGGDTPEPTEEPDFG